MSEFVNLQAEERQAEIDRQEAMVVALAELRQMAATSMQRKIDADARATAAETRETDAAGRAERREIARDQRDRWTFGVTALALIVAVVSLGVAILRSDRVVVPRKALVQPVTVRVLPPSTKTTPTTSTMTTTVGSSTAPSPRHRSNP